MVLREYTPQRRRIMELIMCGVLLATVALAALVSRSANRAHRIELSPQPITHENVTVRLPLQWRAQERDPGDPRVIARATEPSTGSAGIQPRTVRVMSDRIDTPMSPLKYLRDTFGVLGPGEEIVLRAVEADLENVMGSTRLGGRDAVLVGLHRLDTDGDEAFRLRNDIYVAAVLPTLQVIVVHQSGGDRIDVVDLEIAQQIAAAIEINDAGETEPPQTVITLPMGIQLQPPRDIAAMKKIDANRNDRLLWRDAPEADEEEQTAFDLEADWTSIEVVGCVFPHRERDRAVAAMQTLLLARDQSWRGAKVSEQGSVWKAEQPPSGDVLNFRARAYLIPDRSDRALLVIIRAGSNGGGEFERMWKELEGTVRFLPASDIGQMESVGSTEAIRLMRTVNFTTLFGEREEQWWLFTGAGNRPHVGWSNLKWQRGPNFAASLRTRLRSFGGDAVLRTLTEWSMNNAARRYGSETTRTETRVHQPHMLKQVINLDRGRLTIGVRAGTADAVEFKMPAPPQYIPAGVLPMLIGQLDPGPLVIRTEAFLDCDAVGAPELLTVVIRPGVNNTRTADGEKKPMRCVTAEVNGTGRVSRWYFSATGELELIELAGGVTLAPSDERAIRFAFGEGTPMSPDVP